MIEVEENDEFSLDFNFPMKLESEVLNIKVGVHRHILKDLLFFFNSVFTVMVKIFHKKL